MTSARKQDAPASSELFPLTIVTWICEVLDATGLEGRRKANHHLMDVYARPLEVYLRCTSWRSFGEPQEIVHGFLCDRLDNPKFFEQWRGSGKPLRRWLINGLHLYLLELHKEEKKRRRVQSLGDDLADESFDPPRAIINEFEKAYAVSIVQRALMLSESQCHARKLETHWRIFTLHNCQGMNYRAVAEELGLDATRAKEMERAARKRFRLVVQDLLIQDGTAPENLDDTIRALLEIDES
ncbi:MAG: sigma-70 family RNA polymerase sigma factor [Planctomycetes bacterium]|nr:sigma-70 family RNA polymerase sigma factor [Planctomycetota bacterium]